MALSIDLKDIKPILGGLFGGKGDDAPPQPAQPQVPAGPPPPPQATPAVAGFSEWSADPQNQQKVAHAITQPGQPIIPQNVRQQATEMASLNPPPMPQAPQMASIGGPPVMPSPTPAMVQPKQNPLQAKLGADQTELARLQSTGSGVSQIKSPWLRTAARIADVAGTVVAPGVAPLVPGTEARNWMLQRQKQGQIAQDQDALAKEAQLADTQSQTQERLGKARKADAAADDMTPFVMSQDQAAAINHPELAGTQTTQRLYSQMLTGAGHDTARTDAATIRAEVQKQLQAMKPQQRDDHYIAVMSKPASQRTSEDLAFKQGYEQMINTKTTQPGVARAVAGASARPVQVIDPNTNNVVYDTAGHAIRSGAASPGSMDYAAGKALLKDMTSGVDSHTITAGNTLQHHLDLYDKAVDAVGNGDVRTINAIGNQMGIQMGSDAQTNLALIRQGVAMEAARYWTGGVPGEAEINAFNNSLSGDGSPTQMHGGADTVRAMARGKTEGLQGQYDAGKQGKPNFAPTKGDTPKGSVTPPPSGGDTIPASAAAQLQEGVNHTFGNGQVWTKKNGKPVRVK